MSPIELRLTIAVPETAPLTMQKILDFLTDLQEQGIPVAVEGPTSSDLDRRLDELEASIATMELSDRERQDLHDQIASQRSTNRLLRSIGR